MSSVGTIPSELFGSFVGSYEESILNGRMSTTPSKPVPFIAQIGVLSLDPSTPMQLRCPPHLPVPFPAFFYSVQDYDSPSPYVGQLDIASAVIARRGDKPSAVNGYRIPKLGQLQIIIKNPNKTAVKLFLIPYDLTSMPPRTKTFMRQKSYANGILRYAVHLQMCSPSKDKYYVFGSVRVVFANRVPDTNERLRVESLFPDQLGGTLGRWSKWESQATYEARMRRYSSGMDRAEWKGETLEREVILATTTQRGRDKARKGRGTESLVQESVVTGRRSPVPRKGEGVEEGLLARKLRRLRIEKKEEVAVDSIEGTI
jgi:Domain of unknown function (DUF4210)/Chromosome segregation during meiosis